MIKPLMMFFATVLVFTVMISTANAEVFIPQNEFRGYFDQYGIYTAVGVVRNLENQTVIPTVTVNVNDSGHIVSQEFIMAPIEPAADLPFKIKVPEVNSSNPILGMPQIKFATTNHTPTNIEVIYDKTLEKHVDGHTSGYIINNGTVTGHNVVVFAAIYGKDGKFMDVGQSIENITKIEPSEKTMFSMYPEPTFASNVSYYSCFAFGDDPTKIRNVKRGNETFALTYISDAYVRDAKFSDDNNSLIMTMNNPWSFSSPYVNFMFPLISDNQHFSVYVNGKPIDFLQSRDPDGKWHVAFDIPKKAAINVVISGFTVQNTTESSITKIPQTIRNSAGMWSDGTISDSEFVGKIKYLSDNSVLKSPIKLSSHDTIPAWFKTSARLWSSGEINDASFLNAADYLIEHGLLKVRG
jgi:hypothetical protein